MKYIIAIMMMILVIGLAGCGEDTTDDDVDDAGEDTTEGASDDGTDSAEDTGEDDTADDAEDDGTADDTDAEEDTDDTEDTSDDTETTDDETVDTEETGQINITTEEDDTTEVIVMQDIKFMPSDLTIKAGTTVRWEHQDKYDGNQNIKHVITVYTQGRSQPMFYGDTWEYTFEEPGEYKFIDAVFKVQMQGTITVTE